MEAMEAMEAGQGMTPDLGLFTRAVARIRQAQIPLEQTATSELTIPEVEAVIRAVEARNEVLWAADQPQNTAVDRIAGAEVALVFATRVLDGSYLTTPYPSLDETAGDAG